MSARNLELAVLRAAIDVSFADDVATGDDVLCTLRTAVATLLVGQHAGAYGQCPDYGSTLDPCPEKCASGTCVYAVRETREVDPFTWVTRTWVDVREGDVIRPPGVEGADARVAAIGPVVAWGVDDLQPLDAYQQRDIQYNPAKYAGSYAVRRATFFSVGENAKTVDPPITREMKPDAAVDIRVTAAELKAIEALGGWGNRVAVIDNPE